jgi:DNA-binding Lrp family transcriptional regulator
MDARSVDEKSERIIKALRRKTRPYRDRDISVATKLSLRVVRSRLNRLVEEGLVDERWVGEQGPFYKIPS